MYISALVFATIVATATGQACTADYCQNGGICVIVVGNPSCACAAGFIGKTCETAEPMASTACDNDPCLNGGTCTPSGNIFTCQCPSGYTGTVCQVTSGVVTAAPTNPPVTSAPSTSIPAPNCPAKKSDENSIGCSPAEVVFMIEYARGDSYFDVDHEGDFIKRIIDLWRVNDNNMRIGVVTYHDTVSEVIHIDDYPNNPQGLKDRITSLARRLRPSGTNDLAKALEYVRTTSFTNARPNAEKIVIPFVHMLPQSTRPQITAAATKLKNDCVTIIGLGVTNSRSFGAFVTDPNDIVNQSVMANVVTSPVDSHYEQYRDYSDLENNARTFDDRNCS